MDPVDILLQTKASFDTYRIVVLAGKEIETCFEDIEAVSLCAGITNSSRPRAVSNRYFKGQNTEEDLLLAHRIALKLRDRYGNEFLQHCLTLPPLPFKYGNVDNLFSEMDKARKKLEHPIIRFISSEEEKFYKLKISPENKAFDVTAIEETTIKEISLWDINKYPKYYEQIKDQEGGTLTMFQFVEKRHKFSLTFFTEKKDAKITHIDPERLVLRDTTKGRDIAIVQRNGNVIPVTDSSLTKPILGLFQQFMNDPKGMAINFGFETGQCSYCGRDLTDPISLKYGYGKVCAENIGLPYG
jgi:hypothetical protein